MKKVTRKGRGKTCDERIKEEEGKTSGKEGSLREAFLTGHPLHDSKRMRKETQGAHVLLGGKTESWKARKCKSTMLFLA